MAQSNSTFVRTISMDDAASDSSGRLGNELTVFDNIGWKDISDTPAQIGFLFIALCTEGEVRFTIGERKQCMQKGDLLISFGDQIFSEASVERDFSAKAVLMSQSFAQNCIVGLNRMWPYLLYLLEHPVVKMTEEEQSWIEDCYALIRRHLGRAAGRYQRDSTIALVRAFYFEICNLLDTRAPLVDDTVQNRSYAVFDQFIRLASAHFKQERSVEWYSSELCMTPKHLSEVVKQVSGRTAGQWLTTLSMIEIKQLLKDSSLSIKEIAQEMNFPNQSFLGKYFKNIEGCSPSDFRKI